MKDILLKAMKDCGVSIHKAAKEIGIAHGTLKKFIEGNSSPREEVMRKITRWVSSGRAGGYQNFGGLCPGGKESLVALGLDEIKEKTQSITISSSMPITISFSNNMLNISVKLKGK